MGSLLTSVRQYIEYYTSDVMFGLGLLISVGILIWGAKRMLYVIQRDLDRM